MYPFIVNWEKRILIKISFFDDEFPVFWDIPSIKIYYLKPVITKFARTKTNFVSANFYPDIHPQSLWQYHNFDDDDDWNCIPF